MRAVSGGDSVVQLARRGVHLDDLPASAVRRDSQDASIAVPLVSAISSSPSRSTSATKIPDERNPHLPVALYEVAHLFGTLIAETILASVHVRAHKQAGHMDASDLIKALQNTLRGGGRPHMENQRSRG